MKKFIITVIVVLVSNTFFAQAAFDKFDGQADVTSIIVNRKMFDLMSKVKVDASDKETQQYMNLIKKLDTNYLLNFLNKTLRFYPIDHTASESQHQHAQSFLHLLQIRFATLVWARCNAAYNFATYAQTFGWDCLQYLDRVFLGIFL